jgi:hypothetical protein
MTSLFEDQRLPQDFWDKVTPEPNTGCWLWNNTCFSDGYGRYNINHNKSVRVHRYMYETLISQLSTPKNIDIHHICEVRLCCNPTHLQIKSKSNHISDHMMEPERHAKNVELGKLNGAKYGSLGGRATNGKNGAKNGKKSSRPCIATDQDTLYSTLFPSTREAEYLTGIAHQHISQCCMGKLHCNTAGGLTWKWA